MNILNQKNNNRIAFFDSGVGGLTVYSKFRKHLPHENCIYFGDLKNAPYGNKTKDELVGFSKKIFNFFKAKDVKAVVIACNTSSAITYSLLKDDYDYKIYPIIQSSASVIAKENIRNIGVLATKATINSDAYKKVINSINPNIKVSSHACIEWASIVENNIQYLEKSQQIIKNDLDEILKYSPEKIILGCTHYPYLLDVLSKYVDKNIFIDPADYFVQEIKKDLTNTGMLNEQKEIGTEEFYVSADSEQFKKSAKLFYEVEKVEEVSI